MSVPTPTVLDTYQRVMAPAFDEKEVIGVSTMFQGMFGGMQGSTILSPDAEVITVNVSRGNEKAAKWVIRGADAQNVGPDLKVGKLTKFTELNRVFPLMEEIDVITANELNKRLPQEPLYAPWSKQERARTLAFQYHAESVKRIVRKKELAASEVLRASEMTVTEGSAEKITFPRHADLSKALATPFSNAATDVDGEFLLACQKLRQIGKITANGVIMGEQSFVDFYNRTDIQTLADNRRLSFHSIGMDPGPMPSDPVFKQMIEGGAQWQGWYKIGSWTLQIFTYIDGYDTDAGVFTKYQPDDECLVFATKGNRRDRYYGPSDILPVNNMTRMIYNDVFGIAPEALIARVPEGIKNSALIDPRMFHTSAIQYADKAYEIKTQCAPIYAPVRVDTTYRMTATA